VNILCAFGVEICEGETISKRKQTKMVSVDGSESNITVVRGITWFLGYMSLSMRCIPFDIVCDFVFCHRIPTNRNHTLSLCGNIRRTDHSQHDTLGNVSHYLVGTEAAMRKRLAIFEGTMHTEFKAQGMNIFPKQTIIFILYWHSKIKPSTNLLSRMLTTILSMELASQQRM
jgi:hypothetical protein